MASHVLLLATTITLALLCNSQADLISDVCSEASLAKPTCNQTLRSDPSTSGAPDLKTLGKILVEKVIAAAKDLMVVAKSVRNSENADTIDLCLELQRDALDSLVPMREVVNHFGRKQLSFYGSAAMGNIETCNDTFDEGYAPEPDKLKEAINKVESFIDFINAVSILL